MKGSGQEIVIPVMRYFSFTRKEPPPRHDCHRALSVSQAFISPGASGAEKCRGSAAHGAMMMTAGQATEARAAVDARRDIRFTPHRARQHEARRPPPAAHARASRELFLLPHRFKTSRYLFSLGGATCQGISALALVFNTIAIVRCHAKMAR